MSQLHLRKSLVATFINNYFGLGINIVSTIVLARLLSPKETGIYSIAIGIINIAQVMREFGTGTFIIQEKDLTRDKLASAVAVSTGFGLVLGALFALAAPLIAAFFKERELTTIVEVLSANFLVVGFASISTARLQRDMHYDRLMWIGLAQNLTRAAVSILLVGLGYGALGMAWASVISVFVILAGCWISIGDGFLIYPSLKAWRAPMSFGAYSCSGYLLQAISLRMPEIIVGRMLGFELAGIYSRGNGLITLFEQAVMSAVNPVATSALAQIRRNGADVGEAYINYIRYVTAIGWPCLAMMCLLSLPIIVYAFGHQWLMAVPVAQIMCVAAGFVVLTTTAVAAMNATGAVRRFFILQLASTPFELVALLIGCSFNIAGAAWGVTAWSALVAVISVHQAQRAVGIPLRSILPAIGDSLIALSATLALPLLTIWWMPITLDHMLAPTLLVGCGGLFGWCGYIFISGHPIRAELFAAAGKLRFRT